MLPAPLADLLIGLRFFSRLPLPRTAREIALGSGGLAAAVVMVPVAGAIIGLLPAITIVTVQGAGVPPLLAAPLAIAGLVAVTGALHEDGLADCADGFGGGRSRERKLAIMRDSRIGTFGACALGLSLYCRAAALAVVAAHDLALASATLVAAAALSRTLCLLPLVLLPAARPDGAGAAAAGVARGRYLLALVIGAILAVLPLFAGAGPGRVAAAGLAALIAALSACAIARRQIGGQTGDVAGATQQAVEIAVMVVFAAA